MWGSFFARMGVVLIGYNAFFFLEFRYMDFYYEYLGLNYYIHSIVLIISLIGLFSVLIFLINPRVDISRVDVWPSLKLISRNDKIMVGIWASICVLGFGFSIYIYFHVLHVVQPGLDGSAFHFFVFYVPVTYYLWSWFGIRAILYFRIQSPNTPVPSA